MRGRRQPLGAGVHDEFWSRSELTGDPLGRSESSIAFLITALTDRRSTTARSFTEAASCAGRTACNLCDVPVATSGDLQGPGSKIFRGGCAEELVAARRMLLATGYPRKRTYPAGGVGEFVRHLFASQTPKQPETTDAYR